MTYQLRCDPHHGCGGALGENMQYPVQLVAVVFARSLVERELVLHRKQIARRCRACGTVNIFLPLHATLALAKL